MDPRAETLLVVSVTVLATLGSVWAVVRLALITIAQVEKWRSENAKEADQRQSPKVSEPS